VCVATGFARLEDHGQAKVSYTGCQIALEQHILGFEISVSYRGLKPFRFRARDLLVQMGQSIGHGLGNATQLWPGDSVRLEVVAQRSVMLVSGYQPVLRLVHVLLHAQKLQDVGVTHAGQLVDIVLRGPRLLLLHAEDLNSHILAM